MRLEIRELLSEWEENEIDLSGEADIEHIRAKTLCKIGIGTKRRRPADRADCSGSRASSGRRYRRSLFRNRHQRYRAGSGKGSR